MFVTDAAIAGMIAKYGEPKRLTFEIDLDQAEFDRISASRKNGRRHDVTLYIRKDNRWIVIAKHNYPEGMFRSMSGGIHPGEPFEDGARREAREETGCEIELERFLLITDVSFYLRDNPAQAFVWHSYVFVARYVGGDFEFTDTHEIREIDIVSLETFDEYSRIMRQTGVGGLRYRAALHDAVLPLL